MCQITAFGKLLIQIVPGLCLSLLLVACQLGANSTQSSEPATMIDIPETTITTTGTRQQTPENGRFPTRSSTMTVTPAITLQPAPSPLSAPAMTATRTFFHGWLVFSTWRQDTNEDGVINRFDGANLYSLNVATQELNQLTSGDYRDLYPAWSPDRRQIAFASNRGGNFDLYVMNTDGSEIKQLTNTPEDETKPSWSPDGTKIVYVQIRTMESGLQEKQLYLISTTENEIQQLTDEVEDDDPNWSPDGRYIAFVRTEKLLQENGSTYRGQSVYLLDLQENQVFKLTPSAKESGRGGFGYPQWLPRDGYYLSMIQSPGDVGSVDIKVFELLWEDDQPALYLVFGIAEADRHVWGPNGEWLIAVISHGWTPDTSLPNEAFYDFILRPVDFSTHRRALTPNPATKSSYGDIWDGGELIINNTFYDNYPDWSP